jgi:hypothetical protein
LFVINVSTYGLYIRKSHRRETGGWWGMLAQSFIMRARIGVPVSQIKNYSGQKRGKKRQQNPLKFILHLLSYAPINLPTILPTKLFGGIKKAA